MQGVAPMTRAAASFKISQKHGNCIGPSMSMATICTSFGTRCRSFRRLRLARAVYTPHPLSIRIEYGDQRICNQGAKRHDIVSKSASMARSVRFSKTEANSCLIRYGDSLIIFVSSHSSSDSQAAMSQRSMRGAVPLICRSFLFATAVYREKLSCQRS